MQTPEPLDPPWRFIFRSLRKDEAGETMEVAHVVDLSEGEGGACSCEDYTIRARRCKHVTLTREHFLDKLLQSIPR